MQTSKFLWGVIGALALCIGGVAVIAVGGWRVRSDGACGRAVEGQEGEWFVWKCGGVVEGGVRCGGLQVLGVTDGEVVRLSWPQRRGVYGVVAERDEGARLAVFVRVGSEGVGSVRQVLDADLQRARVKRSGNAFQDATRSMVGFVTMALQRGEVTGRGFCVAILTGATYKPVVILGGGGSHDMGESTWTKLREGLVGVGGTLDDMQIVHADRCVGWVWETQRQDDGLHWLDGYQGRYCSSGFLYDRAISVVGVLYEARGE